ncbi:MAG: acetyl-CoA carboxylase biotin carboxyl carrier protein subunit, partial [Muribaculaceae bacterium]|nr:acetyl-CoA carboxylase biotin carboxyl carrier protein subunit [Muribaculaceae bacterium]
MGTGQPLIEFAGEGGAPAPEAEEVEGNGEVMVAPMGGTVLEIKVNPGDEVKVGDTLLVYEAMKMENNLISDRAGRIAKILIADGDVMATDQPIFEFGNAKAAAKPAPKPVAAPAPKPVAAPAPKPVEEAPKKDGSAVKPVDINRCYAPVEGGTSGKTVLPHAEMGRDAAPALRLAEGTTLEINVNPDGGINIRITTGK